MESRVSDCAARHARGFNCAQAIACTYADLVGADEKTMFAATEGLGLGMGGMQGTCGALSGACVICGLANSCADLKGVETGQVLCSCPQCIENAARILEDVVFADAE